ncbi:MAG: hypothetical protein IT452_13040 [Planctomycetia bacterium]|nr:hypothetical protein [Planctomycetia bacterium]
MQNQLLMGVVAALGKIDQKMRSAGAGPTMTPLPESTGLRQNGPDVAFSQVNSPSIPASVNPQRYLHPGIPSAPLGQTKLEVRVENGVVVACPMPHEVMCTAGMPAAGWVTGRGTILADTWSIPCSRQRLDELVKQLADEEYSVRESASFELWILGMLCPDQVTKALQVGAAGRDAEGSARSRNLLEGLQRLPCLFARRAVWQAYDRLELIAGEGDPLDIAVALFELKAAITEVLSHTNCLGEDELATFKTVAENLSESRSVGINREFALRNLRALSGRGARNESTIGYR